MRACWSLKAPTAILFRLQLAVLWLHGQGFLLAKVQSASPLMATAFLRQPAPFLLVRTRPSAAIASTRRTFHFHRHSRGETFHFHKHSRGESSLIRTTRIMASRENNLHDQTVSPSSLAYQVSEESRQQQQVLLSRGLYRRTPLIYSHPMSQMLEGRRSVYLKLDCLQASGSFKDRGMALLCWQLQQQKYTRIVSSSGGNAGLAAATVAQKLQMDCTVVVPTTTKPLVIEKLQSLGATVQVVGQNWNAADHYVREMVAQDPTHWAYVPPYEHELLWQGHSTVIDEIYDDWENKNSKDDDESEPSSLIVSVGGGGLLCGVLEGLERRSSHHAGCQVIAAETVGASSFAQAYHKGELVQLDAIDSVATSLGALQVSPTALQRSQQYNQKHNKTTGASVVTTSVCTDAEAVQACLHFARDHRILVEPACGASLAVVYSERLRNALLLSSPDESKGPIVIEVCGGSGVNLGLLQEWKEQFGLE